MKGPWDFCGPWHHSCGATQTSGVMASLCPGEALRKFRHLGKGPTHLLELPISDLS